MSFTTVKLGLNFWGALFKQQYCILRASKETRFKNTHPQPPFDQNCLMLVLISTQIISAMLPPEKEGNWPLLSWEQLKLNGKVKNVKYRKPQKKETEISHTDTPEINEVSQAVPIMCDKRLEDKNEENKFSLSLLTFQANLRTEILRQKLFRKIWIWENWEIWTKRLWNTNYLFVSFVAKLKLSFARKRNYFLCFRHWVIS